MFYVNSSVLLEFLNKACWDSLHKLIHIHFILINCFTKILFLTVAPKWVEEPTNTSLLLGQRGVIYCNANGYPTPQIHWMKRDGKNRYFCLIKAKSQFKLYVLLRFSISQYSIFNDTKKEYYSSSFPIYIYSINR